MTYVVFFLLIGLITALALVTNQLQKQKQETLIALQKTKELDKKIKVFNPFYNEISIRDNLVIGLTNEKRHLTDENRRLMGENQDLERRNNELQGRNNELQNEITRLYNDIENEIDIKTRKQAEIIQSLKRENKELSEENEELKSEDSQHGNFIRVKILERDLYPQERMEILTDVLRSSLSNIREGSRTQHVINNIIDNNKFNSHRKRLKSEISNLFRDYSGMNSRMKQDLERMGFEMVSENRHYKMVFCRDNRYTICFAKTPSDYRSGRNIASDICNLIL